MPIFTTQHQMTMLELAKRQDPKGNPAVIAEVLTKTNEILLDAQWMPANGDFAHKTTKRASLPTGSWRKLNAGVQAEASTTTEVTEGMGSLESYSEMDVQLAEQFPGGSSAARDGESKATIEGMSQTLSSTLVYGNGATDPEKFTGFAPRLDSLSQEMVIGAGGTGSDLTSIFLVQWGLNKVHMFYPKSSKSVGISHTSIGKVTKEMSDGSMYEVYRDHFQVQAGLCVRDDRCIARIANIETSGSSNIFDEDALIEALNLMPQRGAGAVIYCNRTILTQMDINAKDKTNVQYGPNDVWGRPTVLFRGVPLRLVEAILDTETAIS